MIEFDKNNKLIYLSNDNISYVIYINDAGYLENVYFGKKITFKNDFECIRNGLNFTTTYFNKKTGTEDAYKDGFKVDSSSLELSSHALADKRYSPIIVRQHDGSYESDFRYVSHKIIKGTNSFSDDFPHAHGAKCETIEILLKDKYTELFVKLFLTIFDDKDIIVKNYEIENRSENTVELLRAMSMQLDLTNMDYDLVHFPGRWAKERNYTQNELHDGTQEVSSNLGRSSHEENPFVFLKSKTATADYGEVIGFNLIYSGNFKFRVDCGLFKNARITYGIDDEDFCWVLLPNEKFITPQAVISYSSTGTDAMSQNFHRFIKENLITYKDENKYKPILFNSWEGCFFTFNTESVLAYIDEACELGTELFVLDDGWFGKRDTDYSGLGDWWVNKDKIDLHKIIEHCKNKNIKFGIWFEPEMINYDSNLYRMHPEFALGRKDADCLSLSRHQFHLDFANTDVIDNIYEQIKAFLDEYPVDYIKWDYNRTVAEHYSVSLASNRQGEVYHRLVMGYYTLLSRLTKEFPNIMIEGCASGGGRFDLGTLYYCPQIWGSDESDPIQRLSINYNTSIGYPLSTIGAHVNANKITSYKTKAILALFGTYGYEMNPCMLNIDEKEELKEIAEIYKKYHKKVIEDGTLYHILSPDLCNLMCMQAVSLDKNASLLILMNKIKEGDQFRFIRLKGLDKNKNYRNNFDNCVHSGEYYMTVGLNFSKLWLDEFTCHLVTITEE